MSKEPQQLRVGVLGCGPISQAAHFIGCRKARNAELYAICDLAEDLVSRIAAIHEPKVTYLDYDQMLADPQVEAVIVAVADQFHVEVECFSVRDGQYHRILGEDAHFYKLQIESFANTILHGAPMQGANSEDGRRHYVHWWLSHAQSRRVNGCG